MPDVARLYPKEIKVVADPTEGVLGIVVQTGREQTLAVGLDAPQVERLITDLLRALYEFPARPAPLRTGFLQESFQVHTACPVGAADGASALVLDVGPVRLAARLDLASLRTLGSEMSALAALLGPAAGRA